MRHRVLIGRRVPTHSTPPVRFAREEAHPAGQVTMQAPRDRPSKNLLRTVGTALAGRMVSALGNEAVSRILLYGSRARGDADPESDWDLLVVVEQTDLTRKRRGELRRMCKRGLGKLRPWADVRVVARSEIERGRKVRGSLVEAAHSSGTQIYPNPTLDEGFFEDTAAIQSSYQEALTLLAR